jgi:hypothetical protein
MATRESQKSKPAATAGESKVEAYIAACEAIGTREPLPVGGLSRRCERLRAALASGDLFASAWAALSLGQSYGVVAVSSIGPFVREVNRKHQQKARRKVKAEQNKNAVLGAYKKLEPCHKKSLHHAACNIEKGFAKARTDTAASDGQSDLPALAAR